MFKPVDSRSGFPAAAPAFGGIHHDHAEEPLMTLKSTTLATSALLVMVLAGPTWAADEVRQPMDAAKAKQAAEAIKKQFGRESTPNRKNREIQKSGRCGQATSNERSPDNCRRLSR
jgi:hypothetical protein